MSADHEQRVRTMCGWVGVEISKSRVRTPGKAGYGLYRVRPMARSTDLPEDLDEMWTAYAFTLGDIERAVGEAIRQGTPRGPAELRVRREYPGKAAAIVPTRWTAAYRGRRDLGGSPVGAPVERSTVRSRQREQMREFQTAHRERRRYGKAKRHASVLAYNAARRNPAGPHAG